VTGIKPFCCHSPLCVHQYEELNLGANPALEIENAPVVVDLLISLCYQFACHARSLEGMPSAQALRGWRCGGKIRSDDDDDDSTLLSVCCAELLREGDVIKVVPRINDHQLAAQQRKVVAVVPHRNHKFKHLQADRVQQIRIETPFTDSLVDYDQFHWMRLGLNSESPNWDVGCELASIIDRMPAVREMQDWISNGESLQQRLDEKDGRLWPTLQWILCSMRGHLRHIDQDSDRIPQLKDYVQFVMMSSTPEQENRFQGHAKSSPIRFAFHGSPIANWHSIVRTGLRYDKVTHGRAYGNGIYLGLQAATSLAYSMSNGRFPTHTATAAAAAASAGPAARNGSYSPMDNKCAMGWATDGRWAHKSRFGQGMVCLAVCSVIYRPDEFTSTTPHWVVPNFEWVVTRFLCVQPIEMDTSKDAPALPAPFKARPLQTLRSIRLSAEQLTGPLLSSSLNAATGHCAPLPAAAAAAGASAAQPAAADIGTAVDSLVSLNTEPLKQLRAMFPDIEAETVSNTFTVLGGDIDETVQQLSAMGAHKRAKRRSQEEQGRAQPKRAAVGPQSTIDLTQDPEEEGEHATGGGRDSQHDAKDEPRIAMPNESKIAGVMQVVSHIDRDAAIALLQQNNNHVEDSIAAAFG
jgi:hypothetical protein